MLDFVINFSFPVLFLRFDARYFVYCARCGGLVLLLGKEGDFCRTAGGWGTFEIYSGSDGLPGPANGYPRAGRPWKAVPKRVEALPCQAVPSLLPCTSKGPRPAARIACACAILHYTFFFS